MLIPFPFTDLSEKKVRPAVIISAKEHGDDIIVAFISSQDTKRKQLLDVRVAQTKENGLKVASVIKCTKVATLDKKIILGSLGTLEASVCKQMDSAIKKALGL